MNPKRVDAWPVPDGGDWQFAIGYRRPGPGQPANEVLLYVNSGREHPTLLISFMGPDTLGRLVAALTRASGLVFGAGRKETTN